MRAPRSESRVSPCWVPLHALTDNRCEAVARPLGRIVPFQRRDLAAQSVSSQAPGGMGNNNPTLLACPGLERTSPRGGFGVDVIRGRHLWSTSVRPPPSLRTCPPNGWSQGVQARLFARRRSRALAKAWRSDWLRGGGPPVGVPVLRSSSMKSRMARRSRMFSLV